MEENGFSMTVRVTRIGLWLVATALIALVAVWMLLPVFVSSEFVRTALERELADITGQEIRVEGRVDVDLFPAPIARLYDVHVPSDPAGGGDAPGDFLIVDSVEVSIPVAGLMARDLEFSQFKLVRPTMRVRVDDHGRVDFAAIGGRLGREIERVRREDNWKNTDRVRLVFHAFKQIKDIEAEAIKQAVEALDLENVIFAFVHIAEQHPFLIFDQNQEGLPHWEKDRSKRKGVLGPSRGVHIKLADSESLVVFAGASELKQAAHGMPRACLLKLHRNSTFRDMTYLARQAFDFTAHSWRVMTPEPFPITIKYSDLIAERLAGLKQIETWDDDAVRFRNIGKAPWFL